MSAIDELIPANAAYAASFAGAPAGRPQQHLAVLTCMDTRIDVLASLGLQIGDAHIIRNAGGLVTDDALRSLAISQHKLGTTEIAVIHHTQCGMQGFDDVAFRAELTESGTAPGWDVPGFDDVTAQVRASLDTVRGCPWLPHRDTVRGFVFDVATGTISEVG